MKEEKVHKAVRERYGKIAKTKTEPCGCGCCVAHQPAKQIGYSKGELASVPQGADLNLGCGNPVALASLKEGETVIDLGSGGGLDCFLASKKVGAKGKVIGIDMTAEMLEARTSQLQERRLQKRRVSPWRNREFARCRQHRRHHHQQLRNQPLT